MCADINWIRKEIETNEYIELTLVPDAEEITKTFSCGLDKVKAELLNLPIDKIRFLNQTIRVKPVCTQKIPGKEPVIPYHFLVYNGYKKSDKVFGRWVDCVNGSAGKNKVATDVSEVAINNAPDLKIFLITYNNVKDNDHSQIVELGFCEDFKWSTLNNCVTLQTYCTTFSLQRRDFEMSTDISANFREYATPSRQEQYDYVPMIQDPIQQSHPLYSKEITLRLYVFNLITVEYTCEQESCCFEEEN